MVGVTYDQAKAWIAAGEEQRLLREIVQRFKAAEEECDFLLCEGPGAVRDQRRHCGSGRTNPFDSVNDNVATNV
jgi:hypothetical protein